MNKKEEKVDKLLKEANDILMENDRGLIVIRGVVGDKESMQQGMQGQRGDLISMLRNAMIQNDDFAEMVTEAATHHCIEKKLGSLFPNDGN